MSDIKETATDIKQAGEEKVDAATTDTSAKPTYKDQANEKLAAAKQAAADTHEKVSSQAADTWTKTKEAISNANTYSDKKT